MMDLALLCLLVWVSFGQSVYAFRIDVGPFDDEPSSGDFDDAEYYDYAFLEEDGSGELVERGRSIATMVPLSKLCYEWLTDFFSRFNSSEEAAEALWKEFGPFRKNKTTTDERTSEFSFSTSTIPEERTTDVTSTISLTPKDMDEPVSTEGDEHSTQLSTVVTDLTTQFETGRTFSTTEEMDRDMSSTTDSSFVTSEKDNEVRFLSTPEEAMSSTTDSSFVTSEKDIEVRFLSTPEEAMSSTTDSSFVTSEKDNEVRFLSTTEEAMLSTFQLQESKATTTQEFERRLGMQDISTTEVPALSTFQLEESEATTTQKFEGRLGTEDTSTRNPVFTEAEITSTSSTQPSTHSRNDLVKAGSTSTEEAETSTSVEASSMPEDFKDHSDNTTEQISTTNNPISEDRFTIESIPVSTIIPESESSTTVILEPVDATEAILNKVQLSTLTEQLIVESSNESSTRKDPVEELNAEIVEERKLTSSTVSSESESTPVVRFTTESILVSTESESSTAVTPGPINPTEAILTRLEVSTLMQQIVESSNESSTRKDPVEELNDKIVEEMKLTSSIVSSENESSTQVITEPVNATEEIIAKVEVPKLKDQQIVEYGNRPYSTNDSVEYPYANEYANRPYSRNDSGMEYPYVKIPEERKSAYSRKTPVYKYPIPVARDMKSKYGYIPQYKYPIPVKKAMTYKVKNLYHDYPFYEYPIPVSGNRRQPRSKSYHLYRYPIPVIKPY